MTSVIPRFGFRVRIGVACEQGIFRSKLDDAYLVASELGVVALADGMGAKQAGGLSAQWALSSVARQMASDETRLIAERYLRAPGQDGQRAVLSRLKQVVEGANSFVRSQSQQEGLVDEVGTTLDVAWFLRDEAFLAHVGDARIYLHRTSTVIQVTEEHSAAVVRSGTPDPSRARLGRPTRLTNAVGLSTDLLVDTFCLDLRRGDRVVLLSDGIWSALGAEAQLEQLMSRADATMAANHLARWAGECSFDDRTAIVVDILEQFVRHHPAEQALVLSELASIRQSALFSGLNSSKLERALTAAIRIDFAAGETLPHCVANDRVTYVILDGTVRCPNGKRLGQGGTVYGESLVGSEPRDRPYVSEEPVQTIRIRREDFGEICASEVALAAELYRRLAEHLGKELSNATRLESTK